MYELALFAGAGGGILGGTLLGWTTIGAVEIEKYPREVLLQRQQDGILPQFPIWDDVCTFDGRPWKGLVDIISGGFPCQDISAAGKGAGIDGDRSGLWKEYKRIIGEVRPRFAFVENSPMLTSRGLGTVLGDLAELGYNARWCVLGADDAGAPHERKRIWILAYASIQGRFEVGRWNEKQNRRKADKLAYSCENVGDSVLPGLERLPGNESDPSGFVPVRTDETGSAGPASIRWWDIDPADISNTDEIQCDLRGSERKRVQWGNQTCNEADSSCQIPDTDSIGEIWEKRKYGERRGVIMDGKEAGKENSGFEPRLGRVAHGVAHRVDRLKSIGNGQVPAVAAVAFLILSEGVI